MFGEEVCVFVFVCGVFVLMMFRGECGMDFVSSCVVLAGDFARVFLVFF